MSLTDPKYAVAISFLSSDEAIGAALHQRLSESMEVFFYTERQKELAGTDGMESMRTPFLNDSRLVVVLHRELWGKTKWTRVEETAIKERCFNDGWDGLFFITLDKGSVLPKWLPPMLVRFDYKDYGVEQAVGAIKQRVQQAGGIIEPLTPVKRAKQLVLESSYRADQERMSSSEGTANLDEKVTELFAEVERHCAEVNEHHSFRIRAGSHPGNKWTGEERSCVLTDDRVSVILSWKPPGGNSLRDCSLKVFEYAQRMLLPGDPMPTHFVPPKILQQRAFVPALSLAREYGWSEGKKDGCFLSSGELATRCVNQLLDLIGRSDRGELKRPEWQSYNNPQARRLRR
jgi:hypothetical protein